MFEVDISNLREVRQELNYHKAINSNFKECVNEKAFGRLIKNLGMTKDQIVAKAQIDKPFATAVAMATATNASRQGTKDEVLIIEGISKEVKNHGVNIRNYGTNDKVPIRQSGHVLTRKQAKAKYDSHLLMKSFDFGGELCDNRKIEGFAKVCIGAGGHQDNVFHEASEFLKWASDHGNSNTVYVVLMDTDQKKIFNNLKELEQELGKQNLWVVNHKEFQEKLISLKKEN